MTTLQMIIVTGGYDGSQDVASTEVMDYSGEKILKLQLDNCLRTAKVPLIRSYQFPLHRLQQETWYGAKLESFPLLEAASKEPMLAASFMWLEVNINMNLRSTTYAAKEFSTKRIE